MALRDNGRMNKQDVAEFIAERMKEIHSVRQDGQKEYAHKDDQPFRNFESISEELETSRLQVCWTHMRKHLDGVLAHIKGHTSQRESVHGRFKDLHLYLYLLQAMIYEDEQNVGRNEVKP